MTNILTYYTRNYFSISPHEILDIMENNEQLDYLNVQNISGKNPDHDMFVFNICSLSSDYKSMIKVCKYLYRTSHRFYNFYEWDAKTKTINYGENYYNLLLLSANNFGSIQNVITFIHRKAKTININSLEVGVYTNYATIRDIEHTIEKLFYCGELTKNMDINIYLAEDQDRFVYKMEKFCLPNLDVKVSKVTINTDDSEEVNFTVALQDKNYKYADINIKRKDKMERYINMSREAFHL